MTRHFANHTNFNESQRGMSFSPRAAGFDSGGFDLPVRVMLIAIRHDPQPPVFHGQHLLQRLQALLAAPDNQAELNPQVMAARFASQIPAEAFEETRMFLPPRVLPPLQLPPASDEQTALKPRLVHGDILTDSNGQLYEKFGRQVRPLQRVVSGPRGEILELVPSREPNPVADRRRSSLNQSQANQHHANQQAGLEADSYPETKVGEAEAFAREPQSPATANADMRTAAAHQTAATHSAAPFRKLRPDQRRMRTVRINAANLPAARPMPRQPVPQQPVQQQPVPQQPVQQQPAELRPQTTPPPESSAAATATCALKTAIPEEWIKPWELRLSRDEALYDMRIEASANNTIIGSVRNLKRRIGNRQVFQKWQSLLCGKGLDEQLWNVRPPTGQFSHPQVREWAQRVLAQAGYDAAAMLPEWEIFWRRKGF